MLRIRGRKLLFFCYLTGGVKWEAEVNLEMLRAHYCKLLHGNQLLTLTSRNLYFSFFINLCKYFQCKSFFFSFCGTLLKQRWYT